MPDKSM